MHEPTKNLYTNINVNITGQL